MAHRDLELLEAVRRDDLAAVLSSRYEKPLDSLNLDDTPEMLFHWPNSAMVAAYFGSTKSFNFFFRTGKLDYTDRDDVHFLVIDISFILPPPVEILPFFALFLAFPISWSCRTIRVMFRCIMRPSSGVFPSSRRFVRAVGTSG
jgi:hypothetical protein